MNISRTIAIAAALTLVTSAAVAGTRGHDPSPGKKQHIKDKVQRMLQKFDTNGDGALDAAELEAVHEFRMQRRARMVTRFDRKLGVLLGPDERKAAKRAKMQQRAVKRFDRMLSRLDHNGDGALSWTEIESKLAKARSRSPHKASKMEQRFRAADANGDGVVTRAEFQAAAKTFRKLRMKRGHRHGQGPGAR